MQNIILPRTYEDGSYYISYSQWTSWKSLKSFNLGVLGKQEYILSYFFDYKWPDAGWAEFGQDVEDYICTKSSAEKFSEEEKKTLDKIEPLGLFQYEIKLEIFPGVYLKGYIDDALDDWSLIRDYKTASNSSKERYYKDDYYQLDLYALDVFKRTGKLPDAEVKIIERKGNCFGMVNRRDLLSVGSEIWTHKREISEKRCAKVLAHLQADIIDISETYKVYLKLKNL